MASVKKSASTKSVEPRLRAGPRRRPKPEVREETILHAASLEFCEKGYDAATISDIAKRAGIADGTIYKYVQDKRELLFRVLSKSIEGHVNQTIEGALALETAREKIEYFCYRHLLFWEQNPELGVLYAAESRTRDQHHWPTYRDNNRRYVRVVQDALEGGLAKGEFEFSVPPRFLRDVLIGSVEQVAWGFSATRGAIDPHRMAKEIISIFMRGLTSGPNVSDREGDRISRLERAIERMERLAAEGPDS